MDAPLPAQTARYERKREAILDAAAALFNLHGLAGITLADVAQSVGLIMTSVTYYYRRKEDLAAACLMRSIATLDAMLDKAAAEPSPAARLTRLLELHFAHRADIAEGRVAGDVNFWDMRALSGPATEPPKAAFVALFRRVRTLLRDGPQDGGTAGHTFDPSRAGQNARAHLVLTAVIHSKAWVTRYEAADYPRAAARMADILIHGLAAPGRAWSPGAVRLTPPRSDGGEVSRSSFLRAATELLNENGYHGTSVDRISARLNVTKGSFYHHNDTKDDLVAACFEQTFTVIRRAHAAGMAGQGDGWSRLCSITAALLGHQFSPDGPLLRLSALSATTDNLRLGLIATNARLSEKMAGLISDGIADGSMRPVDAAIAADLVTGMVNASVELAYWSAETTMQNAAERFAKPLLVGVFALGGDAAG